MLYVSGSDSHAGESDVVLWQDDVLGLKRLGAIGLESPSWVIAHPRLPVLYATHEADEGAIVRLAIGDDGSITERQRVSSHGSLPCHVAVDAAGTTLVASNYDGGVVAAWALESDGAIDAAAQVWHLTGSGPRHDRQAAPHAHMAQVGSRAIRVADLGADRILRLERDAAPHVELTLPAGFGPRHFASVGNDRAVIVGELSAEIALVEWGASPRILEVLPATRHARAQPSGIAVRDGEVLVANRGIGTVSTFFVDRDRLVAGTESEVSGENPRAITARGARTFVCLQDLGLIATWEDSIDGEALLTPADHVSSFAAIPWRPRSLSAARG